MRRFFDTNVLVYAYDPRNKAKQDIARSLVEQAIAEESLVVSTQVLVEFYSVSTRQQLMQPVRALELVRLWSEHDTVSQTPELVLRGIALHQEHSLSIWDAMIVQAAFDAHCDIVLSEDLQHGRRFGDLEVVNPFLAPAGAHEPGARPYGASKAAPARKSRKRRR